MNVAGQTICLSMIVKDEAPVIRRCLDSVKPFVDHWVVVDTGSTDATRDIIRDHMRDVPGDLYERPWQNFAHNRSEALELSRPHADYILIIDADDVLSYCDGFQLPQLTDDAFKIDIDDSGTVYQRTQMICSHLPWRYEGVLHEYLTCDEASETGHLTGIRMRRNHDGARRKDPQTYRRDAAVLEAALASQISPFLNSRYRFYLAQSYRDCGDKEKALESYLLRAELGFWQEEVFFSLYSAARLKEQLGHPEQDVIDAYLRAADVLLTRAEALHGASRFCRHKGRSEEGYQIAKRGLGIAKPSDALFLEPSIYETSLLDELAVNAYWAGRYVECMDACDQLLNGGKLPEAERDRVLKNRAFALGKLGEAAASSAPENSIPTQVETLIHKEEAAWSPKIPTAGTELIVAALREQMGERLDRINLRVNHPGHDKTDKRPRVVWMHHDANQIWVQWCKDKDLVATVTCFVFVSYWQRERYLNEFGLPPQRCFVLRHALHLSADRRRWETKPIWRCAYTSTPFRGLSVLLDAWQNLAPTNAELHIWSSMKLYLEDDAPYQHLYDRAKSMPGVIYHGIAPNPQLRAALRTMDFFVYPCTFPETACLAVIEAMTAGCRIIIPSLGALPETTGGFARIYPSNTDSVEHAAIFSEILASEFVSPWSGEPELSLSQQSYCTAVYDWPQRLVEWQQLIQWACDQESSMSAPRLHLKTA
jgi:glycosyltransferase involved in cell wall biosynthesis